MISYKNSIHRILFPWFVWKMDSPDIFLTFDDGPHPVATPIVLNILQERRIKATFFLSGRAAKEHQSLVKEVESEGHSIGVHGFNHTRSMAWSKQITLTEIQQTEEAIALSGARAANIFRPPYGFFTWNTISAIRELHYRLIMWTTSSGDFRKNWTDERVRVTAMAKLSAGTILLMHDNELTKSRVQNVLPRIISNIQERGFTFQPIH